MFLRNLILFSFNLSFKLYITKININYDLKFIYFLIKPQITKNKNVILVYSPNFESIHTVSGPPPLKTGGSIP